MIFERSSFREKGEQRKEWILKSIWEEWFTMNHDHYRFEEHHRLKCFFKNCVGILKRVVDRNFCFFRIVTSTRQKIDLLFFYRNQYSKYFLPFFYF